MSKVLMVYGHTRKGSFAHDIGRAYVQSARLKGHEVEELYLTDLDLEPLLKYPLDPFTNESPTYPPVVLDIQSKILSADRYVFAFPTWWGLPPALVKVFIEVAFAPKVAFKYLPVKYGMTQWEKLLTGKSARLLVTMDSPTWFYRYLRGNAIGRSFKINIFKFCGLKILGINYFGSVRVSNAEQREKWINKALKMGLKD